MNHHGLFGPPSPNPSRVTMGLFAAVAMVIAIWTAIYFDLPSGVVITMIGGTAAFTAFLFFIDALERAERAEWERENGQ